DITQFLDNAIRAAERGASLTQRMLAFARKQDLTLETVDLAASTREMAEMLMSTIGTDYDIATRFPLRLPDVRADRGQLELALVNLVVNSRDAMPGGGSICISAQQGEGAKIGMPGQQFACLMVADEGEGMDEETLARATDPFFTTKGVGKGTGLGLAM